MAKRKIFSICMIGLMVLYLWGCSSLYRTQEDSTQEYSSEVEIEENLFPRKAIQIVVPYAPGGGTDSVARALADAAKKYFNKPVLVVNKTGEGGAIGMTEGVNAQADGYTVTMVTSELVTLPNLGLAPFTYSDFQPILQVNEDPAALTVRKDAPWNTVEDFVLYAKNNPDKIRIGNSGEGSIWHFAAADIGKSTKTKLKHVYFDGAAPAVVNLLGGYIDAVTVSPAEVLTHVKNGELKVLGILSAERISSLPQVPTFKEQGYDVAVSTWRGLGVPKNTPEQVVEILEAGFSKAAQDLDFIEIMNQLELGYKVAGRNEFLEIIENHHQAIKVLIEELGMEAANNDK
ncbi:tripartite tricarboxylate transporter substrate binding protein [Geosporobacter subterraneus]|uniref:tripartite tricarboxylate transporter substrate binding protein n=1 Tax=Geosporobacter subterraneus TaxID=390806 RepID=UPI001A9A6522|nr:tripartite tricarboxylate transporter substrate binding protein [Geosporobacter subterraneus]